MRLKKSVLTWCQWFQKLNPYFANVLSNKKVFNYQEYSDTPEYSIGQTHKYKKTTFETKSYVFSEIFSFSNVCDQKGLIPLGTRVNFRSNLSNDHLCVLLWSLSLGK